jgi:hypothetical protein
VNYTIQQLAGELKNDPTSIGYASMPNGAIEKEINERRGTIDIDAKSISGADLQERVVATEYATLSAIHKDLWHLLLTLEGVDFSKNRIRDQLDLIWTGTTTRTNIDGLLTKKGSRAEQLWAQGTYVPIGDIRKARKLNEGT